MGQQQSKPVEKTSLLGSAFSAVNAAYNTLPSLPSLVTSGPEQSPADDEGGKNFPSFYPLIRHSFQDLPTGLVQPAGLAYTLWKWMAILDILNLIASLWGLLQSMPSTCYGCYPSKPWTSSPYYTHFALALTYMFTAQFVAFFIWYWPMFVALRKGGGWVCAAMVVQSVSVTAAVVVFLGNIKYGLSGMIFLMDVYYYSRGSIVPLIVPIINVCLWLLQAVMLAWAWWGMLCYHRAEKPDAFVHRCVAGISSFVVMSSVVFLILFFLPFHQPPFSGRQLCFKNSCNEDIRIGQIGGSTGISCSAGCPEGTVCNPVPAPGLCYFTLPFPATLDIKHGDQTCIDLFYPPVTANVFPRGGGVVHTLVQWSGALYASTGCHGDRCETAICNTCPPYEGPVGPVTQAEMTLLVNDQDYYDITIINGVNAALSVTPRSPNGVFMPNSNVAADYYCQTPGSPASKTAPAAQWSFDASTHPNGANTMRLVSGGSGSPCPCSTPGEVCGTAMVLLPSGLPTPNLYSNVCGHFRGYWSDDELCAWTDAITYGDCKSNVPNNSPWGGTVEQMFQCAGPYAGSCFQDDAGPGCCGCTTWGIQNAALQCRAQNAAWSSIALPRLQFLKNGCPSCYTWPYDDSTSLFACRSNTTTNGNSYTMEWCPGGASLQ